MWVQIAIWVLAALSFGLSWLAYMRRPALSWEFAVPKQFKATDTPKFQTVFDYKPKTGQAHSPAIVLRDVGFSLVWFEGSEEAQADVDIQSVEFINEGGLWQATDPKPILTSASIGAAFDPDQLVVTLGNTVENQVVKGGLFATVVSVGGWAMASIAAVKMGANGPNHACKLNLSPFLNRSHLVKSPMLEMADGSFALPAYFEMGQTYAVLARMDTDGQVCDTRRITGPNVKPIQPMIIPLDARRAVAFMRNFDAKSKRLLISRTLDGGQSWSPVQETEIENPSSPVAALGLGDERILMAVNDDATQVNILRLTLSTDGGNSWRQLKTFNDDDGAARYPMLRRLPDGDILLTYSHSTKRGVRAHVFNDAWILAQ